MIKEGVAKHPYAPYLFPIISVIFSSIVLYWFTPSIVEEDNYRYMLSALVQSEAAVIGIVITLSLVAVQLTASSYSPRAVTVFRESKSLCVLIGSYTFAILYSLWILVVVESHCVIKIYFSYILGVLCFTLLVPYTYTMLALLEPFEIIRRLSKKITKVNLLEAGEHPFQMGSLQSIFDIVQSSLIRYDSEAAKYGLEEARKSICKVFLENQDLKSREENTIAGKIQHFLGNICNLVLEREDELFIQTVVIPNIREIRDAGIRGNLRMVCEAAVALKKLGEGAAERRLRNILNIVILNFQVFSEGVLENHSLSLMN